MQFRVLVPTALNDGTPVESQYFQNLTLELAVAFGGCTNEGTMQGVWIDNGQIYHDEVASISVVCDNDQLEDARRMVLKIGRDLRQKAMFFEVRYYDGVQILRVEE